MLSFLFLYILVREVVSQVIATAKTSVGVPATTLPPSALTFLTSSSEGPNTGIKGCSACYGVAPIDQIITGVGGSFSVGLGQFTWNLAEVFQAQTDGPSLVAFATAPVITYGGLPIGDPSIYNVFTSFHIVALHEPSGTCTSTTLANTELALPLSLQIPSGATSNIAPQAESSFIRYFNSVYGVLTCVTLESGVIISSTVPLAVSTITVTSSTTGLFRPRTTAVTQTLNISATFGSDSSQGNGMTTVTNFATPTGNSSSVTAAVSGDGSGLSQSAKVGIGIGVGVGGAMILAIIGMIFWKRRTRKTRLAGESYPKAELSSKEANSQAELENNGPRRELENNGPPQELENNGLPQELEDIGPAQELSDKRWSKLDRD